MCSGKVIARTNNISQENAVVVAVCMNVSNLKIYAFTSELLNMQQVMIEVSVHVPNVYKAIDR